MDDRFGTVKQQIGTKLVAVRSAYPADSPMAWLIADPNLPPRGGGHWASYREVNAVTDWDLLTPVHEVW